MDALMASGDWIAVELLAWLVAMTCGFLIVRFS